MVIVDQVYGWHCSPGSVVIQTIVPPVDPVAGDILPAIINPTFTLISIHNTEPVTK